MFLVFSLFINKHLFSMILVISIFFQIVFLRKEMLGRDDAIKSFLMKCNTGREKLFSHVSILFPLCTISINCLLTAREGDRGRSWSWHQAMWPRRWHRYYWGEQRLGTQTRPQAASRWWWPSPTEERTHFSQGRLQWDWLWLGTGSKLPTEKLRPWEEKTKAEEGAGGTILKWALISRIDWFPC